MPASYAAALLPLALLAPAAPAATASTAVPALPLLVIEADFDPATAFVPPAAISHAPDLVPYGSHVRVVVDRTVAGRTVLTLTTAGLAPDHDFPAHLHTGTCGADPAASGPHYQDAVDPVQPSTDPAYANESNELRLTLHTDDRGDAAATTSVAWHPRPGEARSLVLHAGSPAGPHGAGDRAACVNLEF
ncbi:superoxide dismutase family protein [Kitasatospora sp. NPDC088351]|uniref:superoxide dismutase family protein n=1 Tax=unclassified Kitasatospora TaxID=2633591 RepID=UPI003440F1E5